MSWVNYNPGSAYGGSIRYVTTTDGGASWSTTSTVPAVKAAYGHGAAYVNGEWLIAYRTKDGTTGSDSDVHFISSIDDAKTWSNASLVNEDESAVTGIVNMACTEVDPSHCVVC